MEISKPRILDSSTLLREIGELFVPKNSLLICFLGQAGYLIKGRDQLFLIDPYLSNYVEETEPHPRGLFTREFSSPILPFEVTKVDCVFITHSHGDHCDPLTLLPILEKNPLCQIIGPYSVIRFLIDQGVSEAQLHECKINKKGSINGIEYEAIPAAHYQLSVTDSGNTDYVGFLIWSNGITLFHTGDTIPYEGMSNLIKSKTKVIDIGCIPVNGRDAYRDEMGIIGNMHPEEALELASELGIDLMLPMHNDLFKSNRSDPKELDRMQKEKFSKQKIKWMKPGEYFQYRK